MKAPLAIVIGRNFTSRIGMIRAAGEAGCEVVVIQTYSYKKRFHDPDYYSKYVSEYCLSQDYNQQQLLDMIKQYKSNDRIIVLLPTDDFSLSVIDEHLEELEKDFLCTNINHKQGEIVHKMNKDLQKELAKKSGLDVAEGWISKKQNGVYEIPKGINYPCFTKPQETTYGHLKTFLLPCGSEEELNNRLSIIGKEYDNPILIEEYHKIDKEYTVLGLSLDGEAVIPGIVTKIVNWYGMTTTGSVSPLSKMPELLSKLKDFMKEIGLTGLFDIELYESNGKLYFNELNLRASSIAFALTYKGINLPAILINYLMGYDVNLSVVPNTFDTYICGSEAAMRNMYKENFISFFKYKNLINSVDIRSLKFKDDNKPAEMFAIDDLLMPIRKVRRIFHL